MSTYREIHGKAIKSLDTDPSAETDAGQIWYNTSSNTFKSIVSLEAWSSTSPLTQDRYGAGGLGSQTAAVITGGRISPPNAVQSISEEYNGTGFASGGSLNTARFNLGACGTEPAGLAFAGNEPSVSDKTETYNGSSWTAGNTMNTARAGVGGCGTQTAALAVGGPAGSTASESFNGSTWTSTPSINTGRTAGRSTGTSTAAIFMGGEGAAPSYTLYANTESFDGSSWSEVSDMGAAKYLMGQSGSSTAAIVFGGRISSTNQTATEKWDGTSWTTSPATLGTAFGYGGAAGSPSNTSALQAGSLGPSPATASSAFSQEYTVSANVITAAAWSSGTNFPTTSSAVAGAGPRDAAIGIGGYPAGSPPTGKSFEYNGVAWSAEATLNPNTGTLGVNSATGTQTAVINAQNGPGPAPPYQYIAAGEYDGSSWSNATNRPSDNYSQAMSGTQTAGLLFGGTSSPTGTMNITLSYDGTNWTAEEAMNQGRSELSGNGTATAALGAGGYSNPPATYYANTEEYGGESWTASNALLTAVRNGRSSGTQTDAIFMGGGTPSAPLGIVNCSTYNGTSWVTSPSMATTRSNFGAGATSPVGAAWGAAGYSAPGSPNRTNTTEHFTTETTAVNVKTLTQS